MISWTPSQSQLEFLQAFSELNRLPRREPNGFRLSPYKKTARDLLKRDPAIGNTLLGLLACLEHDIPAMHEYHKRALDEDESCFTLIYYAVSLEKSCLWGEAARYGLLALDREPANLKILEAIIKLVPLTGRFSLFKRLLPQWRAANGGMPHRCQVDQEIVGDLLNRHGLQEKDLKEMLAAVGAALSETNVVLQDFRYEIVTRRRAAPFLHFRFAISDELAASGYEDAVDARLAGVFTHPRLADAFSLSIENAGVYRLFESMERELKEHPEAIRVPDPEKMRSIEELVAGVGLRGPLGTANNESRLRFHAAFELVLDELAAVVAKEKERNPGNYQESPRAKLLARIYRTIRQEVPGDPRHASLHQGSGSGYGYQDWKRAKLGERHRLFFKYLRDDDLIIFSWISSGVSAGSYQRQMEAHRSLRVKLTGAVPPRRGEQEVVEPRTIDVTY